MTTPDDPVMAEILFLDRDVKVERIAPTRRAESKKKKKQLKNRGPSTTMKITWFHPCVSMRPGCITRWVHADHALPSRTSTQTRVIKKIPQTNVLHMLHSKTSTVSPIHTVEIFKSIFHRPDAPPQYPRNLGPGRTYVRISYE